MGRGIGTFLKCDNNFQKNKESQIKIEDDSLVQIGASLYGIVNILTKDQYNQFQKIEQNQGDNSFLKQLNKD